MAPFSTQRDNLRTQTRSTGSCLPVRRSSEQELPGDRAGMIGTFFNPEGGPRIQVGSAGDVSLFTAVQSRNCPAAGKTKLAPFFNALVPFPSAKLPSAKFPTILKRACPGSSAAPRVRTGSPHRRSVWAAPSPLYSPTPTDPSPNCPRRRQYIWVQLSRGIAAHFFALHGPTGRLPLISKRRGISPPCPSSLSCSGQTG